jgi:hypothetical protein
VVSITSGTEGWTIESSHTRQRELVGASPISSESSFSLWFVIENVTHDNGTSHRLSMLISSPFLTASSGLNYNGNIWIIWCFHHWKKALIIVKTVDLINSAC